MEAQSLEQRARVPISSKMVESNLSLMIELWRSSCLMSFQPQCFPSMTQLLLVE